MKKRYTYAILFGLPGVFIAGIISIFLFGAITGILWIYVLGDNPWPSYVEPILATLFILTVFTLWFSIIVIGYLVGRRMEANPKINRVHILVSAGLTLVFLLVLLFQQWSVGNLGPKSAATQCGDFCALHGYSGSAMPPEISGDRTCSCYDSSGNEALRIPIDHLNQDLGK